MDGPFWGNGTGGVGGAIAPQAFAILVSNYLSALPFLGLSGIVAPPVFHTFRHPCTFPDLCWGLNNEFCLSDMISHYFLNKTVNSTNPRQPVIKLQEFINDKIWKWIFIGKFFHKQYFQDPIFCQFSGLFKKSFWY